MAKMIFARPDGQWFDFPPLELAGMSGGRIQHVLKPDLIPLPEGATLTMMPLAAPIGFDAAAGEFLALAENPYKKKSEPVYAVAALLPQGFTRLLLRQAALYQKNIVHRRQNRVRSLRKAGSPPQHKKPAPEKKRY